MSELEQLRAALQWALIEGQKGFYIVEDGAGRWYYCRFCRAVASEPRLLNHGDECKLFHVKRLATEK